MINYVLLQTYVARCITTNDYPNISMCNNIPIVVIEQWLMLTVALLHNKDKTTE